MRYLSVPVLGLAAVASAGHLSVSLNRDRSGVNRPNRYIKRDESFSIEALNNLTGGGYFATFGVGTPPQELVFHLDTGSSDTWVNSVDADYCSESEARRRPDGSFCTPLFNPKDSSSFKTVARGGFNITYLDGTNSIGDYFNDTVKIGDISVENQQLGLAIETTSVTGLMGLGYSINVAAKKEYPTLLDNMVAQGLINTHAFSMYLNDVDADAGNILFGAIDANKYIGNLTILPVAKERVQFRDGSIEEISIHYSVHLDTITVNAPKGEEPITATVDKNTTAVLDSGSTLCLLPDSMAKPIFSRFKARSLSVIPGHFVDCDLAKEDYSLDFAFAGKTIRVPVKDMILDRLGDEGKQEMKQIFPSFSSTCMFGITSASSFTDEDETLILGDTFLRSAYVVYDQVNNEIGIAQANLRSKKENIHEFSAGNDTRIPQVLGVEAQEDNDDSAAGRFSSPILTTIGIFSFAVLFSML